MGGLIIREAGCGGRGEGSERGEQEESDDMRARQRPPGY